LFPYADPYKVLVKGGEDLHHPGGPGAGDCLYGHFEGPYRFQPGSPAEAASRQKDRKYLNCVRRNPPNLSGQKCANYIPKKSPLF